MLQGRKLAWEQAGVDFGHKIGSVDEAIVAAGLDWQVELRPQYHRDGDAWVASGSFANVRCDTGDAVGTGLTERYSTVQNQAGFRAIGEVLGAEHVVWEAAGSSKGGAHVWAVAAIPEDWEIAKGDSVKPYAIASLRHDGKGRVTFGGALTRPVCQNTLAMAIRESRADGVSVAHVGPAEERLDDLVKAWVKTKGSLIQARDRMARLVDVVLPDSDSLIDRVLTMTLLKRDTDRTRLRFAAAKARIGGYLQAELERAGAELANGWLVTNAINEWVCHDRHYRGADAAQNRMSSLLWGEGAALTETVVEMIEARVQ